MSNFHEYKYGAVSTTNSEKPEDRPPVATNCLSDVLSTHVLWTLSKNAVHLMMCKALHMFSFGFLAVMLVIYLTELNFSTTDVGLMFTLTLLGDACISILLTSNADKWGRKRTLMVGSLLAVVTSVVFSFSNNFWILLISAVIGVISPSGNEIGPFMSIEISALSQVTNDFDRTKVLAWYNLFGCFSSASGALLCGIMLHTFILCGYTMLFACRMVMVVYSALQMVQFGLFSLLGADIEVSTINSPKTNNIPVSQFMGLHKSKYIVLQLSGLFIIDSFAGSFILQPLICNWFVDTYHTETSKLGAMIFVCNLVAGISALFAAKLADMIGLILTMVVTHLPSNILVILVPLMPNESFAIAMLCLRYSISQMDVPTRNAYVQGVVDADERSAANGVMNVVRSIGASTGPYFAGMFFSVPEYRNYPFYIAGGLKIVYDLLLLHSMSAIKPAHEQQQARPLNCKKLNDSTGDHLNGERTRIINNNNNDNDEGCGNSQL